MAAPTPKIMTATLSGTALTKQLNELHNEHRLELKYVSGDLIIVWVKPSTARHAGAITSLQSCEDGTRFFTDQKGRRESGLLIRRTSYYGIVNGQLKMIDYTANKVTTCTS